MIPSVAQLRAERDSHERLSSHSLKLGTCAESTRLAGKLTPPVPLQQYPSRWSIFGLISNGCPANALNEEYANHLYPSARAAILATTTARPPRVHPPRNKPSPMSPMPNGPGSDVG